MSFDLELHLWRNVTDDSWRRMAIFAGPLDPTIRLHRRRPHQMTALEIIPLLFIEGSETRRMSLADIGQKRFASVGEGTVDQADDLFAVLEILTA